jgi:alkylated DNA repair dioxygenase AlkB
MAPLPLFDALPEGFEYRDSFLSEADERVLLDHVGRLNFAKFEMRGVIARRRVAFFGLGYSQDDQPAPPVPGFLMGLRAELAAWAELPAEAFAMALVNEYRPGAPIGWHRDAPQYEVVAGVSLGSACRMRFRPYVFQAAPAAAQARPSRRATAQVVLAPRSAYLMRGPSRSAYEHSIPPVDALRYSVTFRTLRTLRRTGA